MPLTISQPLAHVTSSALKIFVVEDHPDTLACLRLYLESHGHSVVTARSMHEALVALPPSGCNTLISDIGLSDGDGWELLRRLRLPRPIYAVAMSAFGTTNDERRSRQAGYRHHLLKPFKLAELDAVLAEAVRERLAA